MRSLSRLTGRLARFFATGLILLVASPFTTPLQSCDFADAVAALQARHHPPARPHRGPSWTLDTELGVIPADQPRDARSRGDNGDEFRAAARSVVAPHGSSSARHVFIARVIRTVRAQSPILRI